MDSIYFDEIHKGGCDLKSRLIKAGIIVAAIFLTMLFMLFAFSKFGQIAFLLAVGTVVGAYYLIKYRNKEYEYIFTDGEVDIDIINGQISRKRSCTIKPENVEVIVKYSDEDYNKYKNTVVKALDYSSGIREESYILVVNVNHTKLLIIMSPTQRLIEAWKPYLKKLDYMMRFR